MASPRGLATDPPAKDRSAGVAAAFCETHKHTRAHPEILTHADTHTELISVNGDNVFSLESLPRQV